MEQVIRDYQREHPELTDDEVRAAVLQSSITTSDDNEAPIYKRRMLSIGIGLTAAVAGGAVSLFQGRVPKGSLVWQVVMVTVVVVAVLIGVLRRSRR